MLLADSSVELELSVVVLELVDSVELAVSLELVEELVELAVSVLFDLAPSSSLSSSSPLQTSLALRMYSVRVPVWGFATPIQVDIS